MKWINKLVIILLASIITSEVKIAAYNDGEMIGPFQSDESDGEFDEFFTSDDPSPVAALRCPLCRSPIDEDDLRRQFGMLDEGERGPKETETKCPICLDEGEIDAVVLACLHRLCKDCAKRWLEERERSLS